MSKYHIWEHQPRRDPEQTFQYRTWPMKDRYLVSAVPNVIVQTGLYRYTYIDDWPVMVGAADLHNYLFSWIKDKPVSKRHVGSTIMRAVDYNPRKLKGATKNNEKAKQSYLIPHAEDLRWGLEWMICSWLPTFLQATVAREELPQDADGIAEELEMLKNLTDVEWLEQIVEPLLLGQIKLKEPKWSAVEYPRGGEERRVTTVPKSRVVPGDLS